MTEHKFTFGSDIGGTFTDVVAVDQTNGKLRLGKRLTRPGHEQDGIAAAIAETRVPPENIDIVFHGTTLVINSLLQRRGARTAFITTSGFEDILALGRGNRPQIFNPFFKRNEPIVPAELRFGVNERIDAHGKVTREIDENEIVELAKELKSLAVEAVAICLINGYANPVHEIALRHIINEQAPDIIVSISSDLSGEWREYERGCTTAANAYVMPLMQAYLSSIEDRLKIDGIACPLYILHSAGGAIPLEAARTQPIRMVESGPAGGVVGAQRLAKILGLGDCVSFDMGGTTAKSAAIENNQFQTRDDYWIGGYECGYPVQIPTVNIVEVGAGGGSIAWLEHGGRLRVGPISAGASPGPACYGLGGIQPTVTDANVFCGRIASEYFLGEIRLDRGAATAAIENLAAQAGIDPLRLALGILELANIEMASSVRRQTLERGRDPAGYTLVASGGAGPGHACDVAAEVGIKRVLIPPHAGHFSALGMALSQLKAEHRFTVQATVDGLDFGELNQNLAEIERGLRKRLGVPLEGSDLGAVSNRLWALMRYVGQEHRLRVLAVDDAPRLRPEDIEPLVDAFEREYQSNFGRTYPNARIEFVGFEVEVARRVNAVEEYDGNAELGRYQGFEGMKQVIFFERQGGQLETPVMLRSNISVSAGPAVIYEPGSIAVVPPGWSISTLQDGSILLVAE